MADLNETSSSVATMSKSLSDSVSDQSHQVARRSGNFKPDRWHYDYLLSLDNKYKEQAYEEESKKLREQVRIMLLEIVNPLNQLEFIDTLQRLGIGHHFKEEINKIMENVYNNNVVDKFKSKQNLHETALEFRLLRQHGYDISTDVFEGFKDERGGDDFQTDLFEDIKGMLSLYEASFLLKENETILEEAKDFTSKSLKDFVSKNPEHLISQVKHALEVPIHWRLPRWEARWFIGEYERTPNMNPTLLHLAKLDYNMIQTMYQDEIKSNIRWWERVGWEKKVNFFRYDMYDVYGTLPELELFTEAVIRWDANDLDNLPDYMKVVFFAIYDFADEVASDVLKEKGHNVYPYLKKRWQDICRAYIVEARCPIRKLELDSLDPYSDLVYLSSLNFRLINDLGSFKREMKTGDVPSSIQCYMNDSGASEEEAIKHIKSLVYKNWQKMNQQVATSSFPRDFNVSAWEISRTATFFYCNEDDTYTIQHSEFEDLVHLLILSPFPILHVRRVIKY
ncbi:hypothetical protein K1719_032154 [Acacia pycnantha]|nr:hypothetical protein K1719_032154 [Acacia pycnantha]